MSDDGAVVELARQVIRPLVLEHFDVDSCVATTRITIDVLRYFGIVAEPLAVQVIVFNQVAADMVNAGATPEDIREAVFARGMQEQGGPWTMGIGVPQGEGEEGRHVAVYVPGLSVVADFSLDQASRPHKGLVFEPTVITVNSGALGQGSTFDTAVPQPDGTSAYLSYLVVPDWFRHSPNWRRTSTGLPGAPTVFKTVTGTAIRTIKETASK